MKDSLVLRVNEQTTNTTPPSGTYLLYRKSDGFVYIKDDAGVETKIGDFTLTDGNATTANGTAVDL